MSEEHDVIARGFLWLFCLVFIEPRYEAFPVRFSMTSLFLAFYFIIFNERRTRKGRLYLEEMMLRPYWNHLKDQIVCYASGNRRSSR